MGNTPSPRVTEELLRRIHAEFAEMPGMQLTSRQAVRLWGLDERTCASALGLLVDAGFLSRTSRDRYRRSSDGPTSFPATRTLLS